MDYFKTAQLILTDREKYYEEVKNHVDIPEKVTSMLLSILICCSAYGLIIGFFHSWQQALSSGLKLPILYIATLFICFPTLYIFSAIFGAGKTASQYFVLLLSSLTTISLLLAAFAPIALFFNLTTHHYQFFKLLNVAIFTISGTLGTNFFYKGMLHFATSDAEKVTIEKIVKLWILLFAFVGSQLGWTLRPFFGAAEHPFEIVREVGGNFYINVILTIKDVLGGM